MPEMTDEEVLCILAECTVLLRQVATKLSKVDGLSSTEAAVRDIRSDILDHITELKSIV